MEASQIKTELRSTTDGSMVTAMFADLETAENAYNGLREKGYTKEEINLVMSDETRDRHFPEYMIVKETSTLAAEDAAIGSAIGGTVGAIVGIVAAIGTSIIIPGFGLVIAGPIAAGLAGAGAGTITGGIIGALAGAGIPESHARLYEKHIHKGYILIGFHPHNADDANYFVKTWKGNIIEERS